MADNNEGKLVIDASMAPIQSDDPEFNKDKSPSGRQVTTSVQNSMGVYSSAMSKDSKEEGGMQGRGSGTQQDDTMTTSGVGADGLPEIHSARKVGDESPMNLRGSDLSKRKAVNLKRMTTKSKEVLSKNNFQQLRSLQKKAEKKKALEEAQRKLSLQRTMEHELLEDSADQAKEEGSEPHSPLMQLAQIEEDDEDEVQAEEAKKLIKKSADGNTIELVSPQLKGSLKIRNAKIPIRSNALRYQELMHIESQIINMQTMPDFGYEGDNFIIERSEGAPRNWKLLTDFVYNKDKYEWLQNHLTLRSIRHKQKEEDERKRQHLQNRKQLKETETSTDEKKARFTITAKEMEALEEIKKAVLQQSNFLERFKMMGSVSQRASNKKFSFGVQPQTATNSQTRRSLIDRQKEYIGVKKSRASLSPDQLRFQDNRSLRSSKQSLGFGMTSLLTNRVFNELKSSQCTLTEQQRSAMTSEPNDRERQILNFCEQQQEKLTRALNKTYKDGKQISRIDETQKRLKKLMPAKLAMAQIIRAIKKRDYLLLQSDQLPEIDQIKPVVPEIVQFTDDIKEIRALQKGIFSMQFRRDSPSEDMFVLPQLPQTGRNNPDRRLISHVQSEMDQSKRLIANSIDTESPARHSMEGNNYLKRRELDEMQEDIICKTQQHRDRSSNLHSARQVFPKGPGLTQTTRNIVQQRRSCDQLKTKQPSAKTLHTQKSISEVDNSYEESYVNPVDHHLIGLGRSPYQITAIRPNAQQQTTAASVRLKHSKRSIVQASEHDQSIQQTTMDKTAITDPAMKTLNVSSSQNKRNVQTTLNHELAHGRNSLQVMHATENMIALNTLDPHMDQQNLIMRKASLNLPASKKAMALYKAPVIQAKYKQVVSHFSKPKGSFNNGTRLAPITTKDGMEQSAPQLFQGPYLAESKEYRFASGQVANKGVVSDEQQQNCRSHIDMEGPISPTPFSDHDDGSERPHPQTYSERAAATIVNRGANHLSPNHNKFAVYMAKKKVQNNEYNELMQKPLVAPQPRHRVDAMENAGEKPGSKSVRTQKMPSTVERARAGEDVTPQFNQDGEIILSENDSDEVSTPNSEAQQNMVQV